MSAKPCTYKRPVTPKWSDPDMRIWRAGEARNLIRAAGLPPTAASPIIRTASDRAEDNHDLFFKLVQQQIEDFDKPLPEEDDLAAQRNDLAVRLDKLPHDTLLMIWDLVTDWLEMLDEGYGDEEILLYVKRAYPIDD